MAALRARKADHRVRSDLIYNDKIGKVSVIGVGMRSHPGVSATRSGRWPKPGSTSR
jgi:aspartate kinase